MPSLSKNDMHIVLNKYQECRFKIFVESGTALGYWKMILNGLIRIMFVTD